MGNFDTSYLGGLYNSLHTKQLLTEQIYNDVLSPDYWHKDQIDSDVRAKLVTIAKEFYDHLKLKTPIIDIQLTGSLANYNYTKYSDLDVHVIIDFSTINEDKDLVKKAIDGMRFIWNVRHDIVIKGHDVELYIQDVHEQHTASGLFSLLRNEWIKKPSYNPPEVDERDVEVKYQQYVREIDKMEDLLEVTTLTPDEYRAISKRADKVKQKITDNRNECLKKEGEFCVENLVFKKLRNTNYIEKLIDVASKAYDKIYSDK